MAKKNIWVLWIRPWSFQVNLRISYRYVSPYNILCMYFVCTYINTNNTIWLISSLCLISTRAACWAPRCSPLGSSGTWSGSSSYKQQVLTLHTYAVRCNPYLKFLMNSNLVADAHMKKKKTKNLVLVSEHFCFGSVISPMHYRITKRRQWHLASWNKLPECHPTFEKYCRCWCHRWMT